MKKLNLFLSFVVTTLSIPMALHAAEADNFTLKSMDLMDSSEEVNALANSYLKKTISDLQHLKSCDEKVLYKELRKYFANHSKGELVKDILYKNGAPITAIPFQKSVYKNWKLSDGLILGREKYVSSSLALSPLIKIGDEVIGVDKFEHMFGMGFNYFTRHYLKGKKIDKVLKFGIYREKTILGGNILATGVFSYADLSANFNGMRFWNHVLQKNDDILGAEYNFGPYITCQANNWEINPKNPIDFKNYIDPSMDESINCSKFATKKAVTKFKNSVIERGYVTKDDKALCPIDLDKFHAVKEKYKPFGIEHLIINDDGLGKVSYFNEF